MNPRSWLRSSAARLTLTYSVVVLLLVVALQGTVWWLTRNALENEVRRVMTAELDKLAQAYAQGDLYFALRSRSDSWGRTGAFYLLVNPALTPMAGNLVAWPRDVVPVHDSEVRFHIAAAGELTSHPVRAHVVMLPGGEWLLVGTDISEMERALRRFGWASIWGVIAITLLIVLVGRWFAAQTTRRVREFSATCDAIVHSDLSRRLEVRATGDEFDQLGRTVNDMLERIEQQAVLLRTTYGSIAHDLRTPLYRLRVRMEEALRNAELPAESQEIVQPALAELDRVQRTLATLLEIARAESGSSLADGEPVDLAQLVREMHELYQPAMQEGGLELRLECNGEASLSGNRQLLAGALGIERQGVFAVAGVADFDRSGRSERHRVAAISGWHHTVEQIDPAGDRLQQIDRAADAHQVPWLIDRQFRRGRRGDPVHLLGRLTDAQPPDRKAFKIHHGEFGRTLSPQRFVQSALHDRE